MALELGPHVVDLCGDVFAIQHAGADLDRIRDGAHRCLAGLGPLPHHPCGALVAHRQALDHEAVIEDPDHPVAGRLGPIERQLWLLGRFHGDSRR